MIFIDCPSCDGEIETSLPLPAEIRCEDCATAWVVTDPVPAAVALAA